LRAVIECGDVDDLDHVPYSAGAPRDPDDPG
jgi:hypothetical protein